MDLWIRSQDKLMLEKVRNINIEHLEEWSLGEGSKECKECVIFINHRKFAEYKTKERALEVLDEIQGLMFPPTYIDGCLMISNDNATLLYKMPGE